MSREADERRAEARASFKEASQRAEERHQQLLERSRASERIFIEALTDIDASIKRSNERSDEIGVGLRDMNDAIRANTQVVLAALDRFGPSPG